MLNKPQKMRKKGKSKNFTWKLERFEKHEKSDAHKYAVKKSKQTTVAFRKSENEKLRDVEVDFIDIVLWMAAEEIALKKVSSYAHLRRQRKGNFIADLSKGVFIQEIFANILTEQMDKKLDTSFSTAILLDDGSSLGAREWLSVVLRTDTFSNRSATEVGEYFLYGFKKLKWHQLSAKGILSALKSCPTIMKNFKKIFWVCRDGASVMGAFFRLVAKTLNPFALDIWCKNHLGNLCLKDCIQNDPDIWQMVDVLDDMEAFFRFSSKNTSRLQENLPEGHKGAKTLKRTKNMTRWKGVAVASKSFLELAVVLLRTWVEISNDDVEKKNRQKMRQVKKFASFTLDYRNLCRLFLVSEFVAPFTRLHNDLQSRTSDFSSLDHDVRILKRDVNAVASEGVTKSGAQKVLEIVEKFKNVPGVSAMEEKFDIEARLHDFEDPWVNDVMKSSAENLVESFNFASETRFDENGCKIAAAFQIFDPTLFPDHNSSTPDVFLNEFAKFGDSGIKTLGAWYGEEKKSENAVFEPIVDQQILPQQWRVFKDWLVSISQHKQIRNFRALFKFVAKSSANPNWAKSVSEVLKLLRIAASKPNSTAECERSFSTMKRIVTPYRTSLTDGHVEDLIKISHETKRQFGPEELYRISEYTGVVQGKLEESRGNLRKKRKISHSQQSSSSSGARARGVDVEMNTK